MDAFIDLVKPGKPDVIFLSKRSRRKLKQLRRSAAGDGRPSRQARQGGAKVGDRRLKIQEYRSFVPLGVPLARLAAWRPVRPIGGKGSMADEWLATRDAARRARYREYLDFYEG